ncbi:MAG TPA: hypothetical protein VKK31_29700 [Thermoanaerobaculia bacterium]|nr:hypothetical protein [Thermoanaerobaculia bacterium]
MSGPFTSGREDRLYDLLPAVYRLRDFEQGFPLRDLLRVIAEQVNAVEDDIARLYENWFIETCQDWVVPYIGDLIGYRPVHDAGEPGDLKTPAAGARNKILIPRGDVANTLRNRQRKGTLALLELLARDVAGWPARAVEFYKLVGFTQHLNHLRLHRGRTVDLRQGLALGRLGGPFDRLAHTVDVRRTGSHRTPGRPNLPGVGLFLWRLRSYSVSGTSGYCKERGDNHFTFSVLGNDVPLFTRPEPEIEPTHIAEELNLPIPIRRRAFEARKADYYGLGKSLYIKRVVKGKEPEPIPLEEIVVADLSGWHYQPRKGHVAIDPELGRIAFPARHVPKNGIQVFYHYGFSADIGGGEYDRTISQPAGAKVYPVGTGPGQSRSIEEALLAWSGEAPDHAVVEITDSRDYVEQINVTLRENQTLQIRAARRKRPVIRLLDRQTSARDSLSVEGAAGSAFTLDGLLVTGRGVRIEGDLAAVTVRHSTLVPGWGLHGDCSPREPAEPSLELFNVRAKVAVEHSIVGSILVNQDEVGTDPVPLRISDSIVDATSRELEAVSAPDELVAHARLTVLRSTVFGEVRVHALELGENSIFEGFLQVARRQIGCLRFSSYVPGSCTPHRFNCQPDLVGPDKRERVRPRFRSERYGAPDYSRLTDDCAQEIRRGADDESEMGVFHDLFEPQREANLRARLDEFTPAGVDAGLIFAS